MSTILLPDIGFFSGTYKRGDYQADPFLQKIRQTFLLVDWNDARKLDYFETCLKSNSPAESWYENLPATSKTTWNTLHVAFITQWLLNVKTAPPPVVTRTCWEERVTKDAEIEGKVDRGGEEEKAREERVNDVQEPTTTVPHEDGPTNASTQLTPPPTPPTLTCDQPTTENTHDERVNGIQEPTTTLPDDNYPGDTVPNPFHLRLQPTYYGERVHRQHPATHCSHTGWQRPPKRIPSTHTTRNPSGSLIRPTYHGMSVSRRGYDLPTASYSGATTRRGR
jgi:hypothetical protein